MKKFITLPLVLLFSNSFAMHKNCNNPNNCGITIAEEERLTRYAAQENCPTALLLAYTCDKLTRDEVLKHEKSILENPNQVFNSFGQPEYEVFGEYGEHSTETFNRPSEVLRVHKSCKAEGRLALQEIFKKAEDKIGISKERLKEQKAQAVHTQVNKIIDSLK